MPYFPFFVNIEGEPCLVVGGGNTALRKIEKLLPFKPKIHVVAKNICEEIRSLRTCPHSPKCLDCEANFVEGNEITRSVLPDGHNACTVCISRIFDEAGDKICRKTSVERLCGQVMNSVEISEREFCDKDISDVRFVIAATNNRDLNARITMLCKNAKIPCNSVDDPKNCGFFFPALVQCGDVVVGISTGGKSPLLAAKLRGEIEDLIDPKTAEICERMGEIRQYIKENFADESSRKIALKSALDRCFENDAAPELGELIDFLKEKK